MKQNKQKNINKKFTKGFTLLELLVVVLIIGILAGIALPQYQLAVDKSKFTQLKIAAKAIAEAQHRYILLHGAASTDFSILDIDIEGAYYSNSKTRVYFNNSSCINMTSNIGVWCQMNKPKVAYTISYTTNFIRCIAYDNAGPRSLRLCQNEFSGNNGQHSSGSYCSGTPCTVFPKF